MRSMWNWPLVAQGHVLVGFIICIIWTKGTAAAALSKTTTALARRSLPNPCENPDFLPPVYQLRDFFARKRYEHPVYSAANFTLVDVANGYSVSCGTRDLGADKDSFTDSDQKFYPCQGGDILSEDGVAQGHYARQVYRWLQGPRYLQILHEWICHQPNGSYPLIYVARHELSFAPLDCPDDIKGRGPDGDRLLTVNCTLTETTPITKPAFWSTPKPPITDFPIPPNNATVLDITAAAVSSGRVIPSNEKPCIGRSFSYPGWYLDTVESRGGQVVNLALRHKATNYSAGCTNTQDGFICTSAHPLTMSPGLLRVTDIQASFDPSTRELEIHQRWQCAEESKGPQGVEFQAAGRTTLPPPTSQQEHQVIEIQGTLTKPISLTPVPPPVPLGIKTRDCLEKSKSPQWTISNFKQWQSRQFFVNIIWSYALRVGDLHLDLHNAANNVTVPCRLRDTYLTNYTDSFTHEYSDFSIWWSCDPPKDHQSFPKYSLSTAVQLNKQKLTLGVRQTWYCTDEGDTRPTEFAAQGEISLAPFLQCVDVTPPDPPCTGFCPGPLFPSEWPYNRAENCTLVHPNNTTAPPSEKENTNVTVSIPGTLSKATLLAPLELTAPQPSGHSCAIDSVLSSAWSLVGVSKPWAVRTLFRPEATLWNTTEGKGTHETVVLFGLRNFGTQFGRSVESGKSSRDRVIFMERNRDWGSTTLTPHVNGSAPQRWYPCDRYGPGGWLDSDKMVWGWGWEGALVGCAFRMDFVTGYFAVKESWVCEDKDKEHPILFEATGSRFLDLKCSYREIWPPGYNFAGENGTGCDYTDRGPIAPTTLTWRTLPRPV